jgi:hypothetical protein
MPIFLKEPILPNLCYIKNKQQQKKIKLRPHFQQKNAEFSRKNLLKLKKTIKIIFQSKSNKKMEKTTISTEQLKKLQDFNAFIDKAKLSLGELSLQYELQKANILAQVSVQQEKVFELEKEIREEYGDIKVNIETGEIIKEE